MKIFWSWQDDVSPKSNRHFIKKALEEAVEALAEDFDLDDADRPALDHDTKGVAGAVEIMPLILEKIAASAVFVADVTPVGKTGKGKAIPNPNVMVELGWSLANPGWERQIYILNTASGWNISDLPFDIRGRRILRYAMEDGTEAQARAGVRKRLVAELTEAIRTNLAAHIEEKAEAAAIDGVAVDAELPSIWAGGRAGFTHQDSYGENHWTKVSIPDGPRTYLRVIPSGWRAGVPDVSAIGELRTEEAPYAPTRYSGGDFGATSEGYVRYWICSPHDQPVESQDVMMFFEDTGEFWMINGSSIVQQTGRDHCTVPLALVFSGWATALRRINKVLDGFGALPMRRVEVGFTGFDDVRLTPDFMHSRPPARRPSLAFSENRRDWDQLEVRDDFLVRALGKVCGLFGVPILKPEQAKAFVAGNDPERRREGRR